MFENGWWGNASPPGSAPECSARRQTKNKAKNSQAGFGACFELSRGSGLEIGVRVWG